MLLNAGTGAVANCVDEVLGRLPATLASCASAETHACVLELRTAPHATVAGVIDELRRMRRALEAALGPWGLRAGAAGTHPLVTGAEVAISAHPRYRSLGASMRALARREPTMALHVHVAVPRASWAVRALDGIRSELPVVLAVSANSPFWRGADSGFASSRTPIFSMFPRVGIPRRFGSYAAYVRVVEALVHTAAIPDPSFLWWDARLQPRLGTVEVRISDAQSRVADVAAIAAFVQCAVRHHAASQPGRVLAPEVLDENRFLAARDGVGAQLADARTDHLVVASDRITELLCDRAPLAAELGCRAELESVAALAGDAGYQRQRRRAAEEGIAALPAFLGEEFVATVNPMAAA